MSGIMNILLVSEYFCPRLASGNVRCIIMGDGPESQTVKGLLDGLGFNDNIELIGQVKEATQVYNYMRLSKLFVLPSIWEGFGIVVLDANAGGLSVIAVKHPKNAASDLIVYGKNGFLCLLDSEYMAQKIRVALERSQEMSLGCVEYTREYE